MVKSRYSQQCTCPESVSSLHKSELYMPTAIIIELLQLTGIAAILRFPMTDFDEHQVAEEVTAAAAAANVDKLTSTLTATNIQDEETKQQLKGGAVAAVKKSETPSSSQNNTPTKKQAGQNKAAQKPSTPKVNFPGKKSNNKYDYDDEYGDDYADYDDYDEYY
jgi:hypothetical protein